MLRDGTREHESDAGTRGNRERRRRALADQPVADQAMPAIEMCEEKRAEYQRHPYCCEAPESLRARQRRLLLQQPRTDGETEDERAHPALSIGGQ